MKDHNITNIILTITLVVIFGWSAGYIVLKGIEMTNSDSDLTRSDSQKAVTLKATVVKSNNPRENSKPDTKLTSKKLTVIVGGDVMFDRGIRAIGDRNGYNSLFDPSIISLFKQADITAVNLEGPITSNPSKTLVNGKTTESFTFTFDHKSAVALKDIGVTIVSLANNHTDNFGFSGFTETQQLLSKAGVSWFGNPWNSTSSKMSITDLIGGNSPVTMIIDVKDFKVAFVGYHSFQLGVDRVVDEIRQVSGPDVFTIVMPHWGEEYMTIPSELMKSRARAFISAGADAIIGAHPHVVMEQEWVGVVPIYYSVGNLLFDQYFSPEVMSGKLVELHLIKDTSKTSLDYIKVHEIQIKPGKGVSVK